MERGRLTRAIQRKLAEHGEDELIEYPEDMPEEERPKTEHQKRWGKVWGDFACLLHKRQEDEDTWHWGDSFFGADIGTLRHIAALVGAEAEEV